MSQVSLQSSPRDENGVNAQFRLQYGMVDTEESDIINPNEECDVPASQNESTIKDSTSKEIYSLNLNLMKDYNNKNSLKCKSNY